MSGFSASFGASTKRLFSVVMVGLLLALLAADAGRAQDGFDLPAPLFLLTNSGQVQRIGLGAEGLTTVTPGDVFVVDFGVAPDGNWLAYRGENGLFLRHLFTQEQVTVDADASLPPYRGRGPTIAWSPNGDALAWTTAYGARVFFQALPEPVTIDLREGLFNSLEWAPGGGYLLAEAENDIWWMYRREGALLVLTAAIPGALGAAWSSPTSVAFAPLEGGLQEIDLAAGNTQRSLLSDDEIYALPTRRPDGTLATLGRPTTGEAALPEGSARLVTLARDNPESASLGTAALELNGLRWAPGGGFLLALRGGVLALVLPETGEGFALPFGDVVAYDWGPPPADLVDGLPLSADGYFLAEDDLGNLQVWQLPQDGRPAQQMTIANAAITAYAIAPGGERLAYVADGRLWLQTLAGAAAPEERLTVEGEPITELVFSPDGSALAYVQAGAVWQVRLAEDEPQPLLRVTGVRYSQPAYAPTINALAAVETGEDRPAQVVALDLTSGDRLPAGEGERFAWIVTGALLVYQPQPEFALIYRADSAQQGGQSALAQIPNAARLLALQPVGAVRARLALGREIAWPWAVTVVDLQVNTGALSTVGSGGFMLAPQLSPDGRYLAGQTHPGGRLTIRDLETGQQVTLRSPAALRQFQWLR